MGGVYCAEGLTFPSIHGSLKLSKLLAYMSIIDKKYFLIYIQVGQNLLSVRWNNSWMHP